MKKTTRRCISISVNLVGDTLKKVFDVSTVAEGIDRQFVAKKVTTDSISFYTEERVVCIGMVSNNYVKKSSVLGICAYNKTQTFLLCYYAQPSMDGRRA